MAPRGRRSFLLPVTPALVRMSGISFLSGPLLGGAPYLPADVPSGTDPKVRKTRGETRYRVGIGSFMEKLKI